MRPERPGWLQPFSLVVVLALGGSPAAASPAVEPYDVPPGRRAELQTLLDRHQSIRLEPDADYGGAPGESLVVASGQHIVGGWNTRVPPILIPGGVSNVSIVQVRGNRRPAADVTFLGGAPNDDVEIVGGNGGPGTQVRVLLKPGSRVNRLRLTEFGGLEVQQARSGFVRDSVFTRMLGYWPGPQLLWLGNSAEPSRGNRFLGLAAVTPGRGGLWKDAGDLWLVGWDCETWNERADGWPRCFSVDGATRVVSIGLSGGTARPALGGAIASFTHLDGLVSWFRRGQGGQVDGADVVMQQVGSMLSIQSAAFSTIRDSGAPAGFRAHLLEAGDTARLPAAGAMQLERLVHGYPRAPMLAKPALRVEPVAALADSAAGTDDAAIIQSQIDAHGVARLGPRSYHLARPLRIGSPSRVEGIVGAGRNQVRLVADGDFALIAGRPRPFATPPGANPVMQQIVLWGLTLQGGSHGIRWSGEASDTGPAGQIAWSTFGELRFVGQRVAGVEATGIFGLDSNVWYRVDFVDVPIAFRGRGLGAGAGMNYADKQLFLDCQYRNVVGTVWEWLTDRPSGGEIWKDNYFYHVGQLSRTRAGNNLMWVNSVMDGVSGPTAIEVTDRGDTATYDFYVIDSLWRGRGPAVVTDPQSDGLGTLFIDTEFAQQGGSLVGDRPHQVLSAWGSRVTGTARLGTVESGVLIDSQLGTLDASLVIVRNGRATELLGPAHAPTQ